MIDAAIQQIIADAILAKYPDTESIWLYGSRAVGILRFGFMPKQPPKPNSDYDICVKMPQGSTINRHDHELDKKLLKVVGNEVHIVFSTKRNAWMEEQLWGFPAITAMKKKDTAYAYPSQ